jgi:N-acyl-L-homoserine lactone synthetase
MNTVVMTQEDQAFANPVVNQVFKLRHETFIDRLDWEITSTQGMERDQFDDLDAFHIAVKTAGDEVVGCWRALPTTDDYMLKNIFPELLQGEAAPELDDVWEISRFAVRKGSSESSRGYMSTTTIDLVKSFHEFAVQKGIKSYVTVTTVACERMLRQLGVNLRRMGEGKALQVGKERSVALWINVDSRLMINAH